MGEAATKLQARAAEIEQHSLSTNRQRRTAGLWIMFVGAAWFAAMTAVVLCTSKPTDNGWLDGIGQGRALLLVSAAVFSAALLRVGERLTWPIDDLVKLQEARAQKKASQRSDYDDDLAKAFQSGMTSVAEVVSKVVSEVVSRLGSSK